MGQLIIIPMAIVAIVFVYPAVIGFFLALAAFGIGLLALVSIVQFIKSIFS